MSSNEVEYYNLIGIPDRVNKCFPHICYPLFENILTVARLIYIHVYGLHMEFTFNIETILKGHTGNSIFVVTNTLNPVILDHFPVNGAITCEPNHLHKHEVTDKPICCRNPITHSFFRSASSENGIIKKEKTECDLLSEVIDRIGEASARAQSLNLPVTTTQKLISSDHMLFIMKDDESINGNGSIVGILKAGRKKLFLVDEGGKLHEMNPICVLDFYVHESRQRKGYGKELFEALLKVENIFPHDLAIDKPSPKFLGFLRKHYNMVKTIPQANSFVIFSGFFDNSINGQASTPSPVINQRHSFAGVGYSVNNHNGRPHSLGGIESCLTWKHDPKNEELETETVPTREVHTGKRMYHDGRKRNSSSWNVFGVLSPDYTQGSPK